MAQISDEDRRRVPGVALRAVRAVAQKKVMIMETRNNNNSRDRGIRGIGWFGSAVGALLLAGLALELLAHQVFGPTDVATLLLALYLAGWFSILGIVGFLILSIAWLLGRPAFVPAAPRTLTAENGDRKGAGAL
ncbi:hypothetical protein [Nitrospira sp. Nam80]